jgi:hypothetical protein
MEYIKKERQRLALRLVAVRAERDKAASMLPRTRKPKAVKS